MPSMVARAHRAGPGRRVFALLTPAIVSLPGCVTVASSARPGGYQVQARDSSVASPVRSFKLVRWPAHLRRPDPLVAAQDRGERLADVVHLLYLHQVGEAVGALQGRS